MTFDSFESFKCLSLAVGVCVCVDCNILHTAVVMKWNELFFSLPAKISLKLNRTQTHKQNRNLQIIRLKSWQQQRQKKLNQFNQSINQSIYIIDGKVEKKLWIRKKNKKSTSNSCKMKFFFCSLIHLHAWSVDLNICDDNDEPPQKIILFLLFTDKL